MKIILLSFLNLFVFSLFSVASNAEYQPEMLRNRYEVYLSPTDRGTLYMTSDHSFTWTPSFTNKDYVHVCWGKWKFSEKLQQLEIKNADRCEIMNGIYKIERTDYGLLLEDRGKKLVLNYLVRPLDSKRK